jgi:hypothetical protein
MKKYFSLLLPVAIVLILTLGLSAGDIEAKGKAWLGSHSDTPAINVSGSWHEAEWGTVTLTQAQGSRDVTGDGDRWDITGVVSGNQVFLVFSHKGKVAYTAKLTSESDKSLNGSYLKGFLDDKSKGLRPMHLIKPSM